MLEHGIIAGDQTVNETESSRMASQEEPILQFFDYGHLPLDLQDISRPFCQLALDMLMALPRNPERSTLFRKLLEAKDAAVRAKLYK